MATRGLVTQEEKTKLQEGDFYLVFNFKFKVEILRKNKNFVKMSKHAKLLFTTF